jgi:hypothetical protein
MNGGCGEQSERNAAFTRQGVRPLLAVSHVFIATVVRLPAEAGVPFLVVPPPNGLIDKRGLVRLQQGVAVFFPGL